MFIHTLQIYCIDCMSWLLYRRPASKWRHPESHVCAVWWCYWTDLSGGFHMPCHASELHGQWVGLQKLLQCNLIFRKKSNQIKYNFLFLSFHAFELCTPGIMFWIYYILTAFILFTRDIPETLWKRKDNSWWKWGNADVSFCLSWQLSESLAWWYRWQF